jgi:hypothetical protein
LGARAWEAESCAELADLLEGAGEQYRVRAAALAAELGLHAVAARTNRTQTPAVAPGAALAVLRRDGELWEVGYRGCTIHLRDAKGLHDLAALVRRPEVEVHVLDLASPQAPRQSAGGPVLDARARTEYRRRLAQLDQEQAQAQQYRDESRHRQLTREREALLAELRTAAGLGGRARLLGGDVTERARKAVTSRLRDAIRRIQAASPELGAHLDRSVVTGTSCRYQPTEPVRWVL